MSRGDARSRAIELVVRVLAPASAALVLVAFLGAGAREVRHDLHVIAPEEVRAGDPLPARAHVYAGLRRTEGASLVTPALQVELRLRGRTVASAALVSSFADTLEGELAIPASLEGEGSLVARTVVDGEVLSVERAIAIKRDALAPEPLVPRPLRALQQLSAGPIRASASEPVPAYFEVRVRGGACVPELPCEVAVHVGEPSAAISVEETPSVSAVPSTTPSTETAGVALLEVTTHGPEARLELQARRAGVTVAKRAVRLPNALGSARLSAIEPVLAAPASPTTRLLGSAGGCIVDAFRDARWLHTSALPDCAQGAQLPFAPLGPGLWRLQARTDPFSADAAAVRAFYVRRADESDAEVLRALADAALALDTDDALARAVHADPAAFGDTLVPVAGALLATLEADLYAQPTATSSLPAATARLVHAQGKIRTLALAALALAALALALLVAARGVRGAVEASKLLERAGSPDPPSRTLAILRAIAAAVSLVLVFAAIAVYLLARGG